VAIIGLFKKELILNRSEGNNNKLNAMNVRRREMEKNFRPVRYNAVCLFPGQSLCCNRCHSRKAAESRSKCRGEIAFIYLERPNQYIQVPLLPHSPPFQPPVLPRSFSCNFIAIASRRKGLTIIL
jgi:hypothetical protein